MQFRILGPLEAVERDIAQPLGAAKQRAVLAILILHRGELVSSERLADELWGERPPATATKTLQGYISRLRKAVGEDMLHTRGRGYVLALQGVQLDVDEFERLAREGRDARAAGDAAKAAERLREALGVWRGAPLADFTYEPFAQAEIARLEEARLATIEDRIEADLALGRHRQLVAELERLVRERPLRERLRGQLMLSLYRAGRQADALEAYRIGRRAMIDELGIEPGRALQDMEAAILRHDATLDPPVDAVVSPRASNTGQARDGHGQEESSREPVLGREEQLAQLRSGLDAAIDGRGTVFMIGGEAGVGKSRLADELARDARQGGARVAWGRCWEAGGAPAYWPWVQALRSLLRERDKLDMRLFRGPGANSLLALIPEQREPSDELATSAPESEAARFALFDAVAWLLREASGGQPVMIVLDDLHAADTPSLLLLQFLAGQLGDTPLMVVGLYRDEDPSDNAALSVCLASLARDQAARRMRLTGLTAADTSAMIDSIAGRPVADSVARTIHAETEGNPRDAYARAGDEPVARDAFLKAATLAASTGLPVLQAQAALGYGGRFVWSRAYNDVHLIPLLEAALRALPAEASPLRVRLMARLSGALRDHSSRERRASLSDQAVQIARDLGDPATLAYALDGHYSAIMWPETPEQRVKIADEIIALAQQVADSERATAGRIYRVIANMELGRMSEAERELQMIAEEAAALRQPAQLWMAAATRANLALFQGRFDEARALIDEALTLGQRAQRRDAVLSHRLQLFLLDREVGDNAEISALISDAASEFPTRPVFRCALAYIHAYRADATRAQVVIDDLAANDFAAIQRDNEYLFALAFIADAVDAVGDVGAAAVLYDLLVPYAHLNAINADEAGTGSVSRTLGILATALSRWDDGAQHFEAALTHNQNMGALPWLAHTQHDYAKMLLTRDVRGDRERAHQLLAAAVERYRELRMAPWLSRAAELTATP